MSAPSPPPLPLKVAPPPPPAPAQAHSEPQPSSSTPARHRPDAHVVPITPSPASSTPTHRSTPASRSTHQPSRQREAPRSRTTSIDYGRSSPFGDFDSPAHDDSHSVPLLPTSTSSRFVRLNLDKDVPDLPDDEQRLLPSSPSSPSPSSSASRRRPRRSGAAAAAAQGRTAQDCTRRCARWFLLVVAGAAGVVVLVALLSTEDARASARGKVDEAVQAVGGWVGVGTVAAGGGTSAEGAVTVVGENEKGGDGDEVTLQGGEKVVYRNALCVSPSLSCLVLLARVPHLTRGLLARSGGTFDGDPHSLSARAQDDSPALSEAWDYERLRIRGVNLGGCVFAFLSLLSSRPVSDAFSPPARRWLTLEPFITPHLFEPFLDAPTPAEDEYTLSQNLRDQGRLENTLQEHYDTFIVRLVLPFRPSPRLAQRPADASPPSTADREGLHRYRCSRPQLGTAACAVLGVDMCVLAHAVVLSGASPAHA